MGNINIALTGMGGYGGYYVNALLGMEDVDFVGIIDPHAANAPDYQRVTERGIRLYDDMEAFYTDSTADLMIVSTPIALHKPHTLCALSHGSHVLCEKPTAATVADALEMQSAADRAGKRVFVGFQMSYAPPILALKRDIMAGVYGRPRQAKSMMLWERTPAYYNRNNWAGKLRDGNGNVVHDSVLTNATAHYLHNLYFVLGGTLDGSANPTQLEACLARANDIETFDTCTVRGTLDNGAELLYIASHAAEGQVDNYFELLFDDVCVKLIGGHPHITAYNRDGGIIKQYDALPDGNHTDDKLTSIMAWMRGEGDLPPCGIPATLPFMRTADALFRHCEMQRFPDAYIRHRDGDGLVYANGLTQHLARCYDDNALLNEIARCYDLAATRFTL